MSKNTILKYTYDKNFKHKRHKYGYIDSGVCIEIGFWNAIWDLISSLLGVKNVKSKNCY